MFKQEKGITLVALVITIIVLLILAGVSISLVVGDNGILTQANKAKSETAIAQAREAVGTAVAGCQGEFTTSTYVNNSAAKFSDYLNATNLNTELNKSGYKIIKSTTEVDGAIDEIDVLSSSGFYIVETDYEDGDAIYVAKLEKNTAAETFDVKFVENEFSTYEPTSGDET